MSKVDDSRSGQHQCDSVFYYFTPQYTKTTVWILIKREFYFFIRNYAHVYTVEAKYSNRNSTCRLLPHQPLNLYTRQRHSPSLNYLIPSSNET